MGAASFHLQLNSCSGYSLQSFAQSTKPTWQKDFRCYPAAFQLKKLCSAYLNKALKPNRPRQMLGRPPDL